MEHRYSPRQNIHLKAILITHEGNQYLAEITEYSSMGLRAIVKEALPENIKVVEVLLLRLRSSNENIINDVEPLKMFVARRKGNVIGLCVFNEQDRISPDLGVQDKREMLHYGLLANS